MSRFIPSPIDVPGDSGSQELRSLLERNLSRVLTRIGANVPEGGRAPELVAVTKTVSSEVTLALVDVMVARGLTPHLAENRADRFEEKVLAFEAAGVRPRWHFIGHIQRNKARRILERADVLHSVDSLRLAETVVRIAEELERDVEVFIEVNLTGETEKHGLLAAGVPEVLEVLAASPQVQVAGLMAMGPARDLRTVDEVFFEIAALARDLELQSPDLLSGGKCRLSMGMSGDLEAALQHGSRFVRIGSALFEDLNLASPPSPRPADR
ncbi:Pyridoxal phosphate homeostasis protein [Planctomycetes bacterium Poly30]|uniref:Pyridoxal phosphate homeostasis protein n=1 Tax=Saltatorellus ferox TaxID=2528018 RepID=A0A518ETQ5_9BACT|nr:Pyridoxal phosphate homeostasis protein [Planctomycetes bacterium Poly30]